MRSKTLLEGLGRGEGGGGVGGEGDKNWHQIDLVAKWEIAYVFHLANFYSRIRQKVIPELICRR